MLIAPLVGTYFRPPANLILRHLASETPLLLERDKFNPYDENAVKVMLALENLPDDISFEENLSAFGTSLEILRENATPIHLGYIARQRAQEFHAHTAGVLLFLADGKPAVGIL